MTSTRTWQQFQCPTECRNIGWGKRAPGSVGPKQTAKLSHIIKLLSRLETFRMKELSEHVNIC
jgi:hypothetical protein